MKLLSRRSTDEKTSTQAVSCKASTKCTQAEANEATSGQLEIAVNRQTDRQTATKKQNVQANKHKKNKRIFKI